MAIIKHRNITENGLRLIKTYEGFSVIPYYCTSGFLTVGWGHVVLPSEKDALANGNGVSIEEATELLRKDLFKAERSVLRLINIPLRDCQFDSLVSFAFNAGGGALQTSTLRMKLNREEPVEDVAQEFMKWVWSAGKRSNGLIRRRKAEREMFLG